MSVALIFPPIVNSGFGSYYPSLAVLAGYLQHFGFKVAQIDLNERLAEHLLEPGSLASMGRGIFFDGDVPDHDPADMACSAARLLERNRVQLFDEAGRHRFSEAGNTPAYLLSVMAKPLLVDVAVPDAIELLSTDDRHCAWYRRFYASVGLAMLLPEEVTLIGLSVPMGPQLFPAMVLVEFLKTIRPNARIVLGGPTMSLMREWELELMLRRLPAIDAIVRYEGEAPLFALCEQATEGTWHPAGVPGISCLEDDVVKHQAPGPGPVLDRVPPAAYDPDLVAVLADADLGVVQTRGCYWGKCAYCDFVELYDGSPRYRSRSPASFVDEVATLQAKYNVRRFSLITEAIPPAFSMKFSNLVIERGLDMIWGSFAMVDRHFTPQHFEAMVKSGCDHLVIGLETMTDRVLALVHKYSTGNDNERFLRMAHAAGIRLLVNLIPDLPTTTYAEAMASLERMETLADTVAGVMIFPFEATRSSQLGRTPEKYGIQLADPEDDHGQAIFASNHLRILDNGMTAEQRVAVHAAFQAYADRVNGRRRRAQAAALAAESRGLAGQTMRLRVAREDNDILRTPTGVQVFNWRTQARWQGPAGLRRIIDRAESVGSEFTASDLMAGTNHAQEISFLVEELTRRDVFVPVIH